MAAQGVKTFVDGDATLWLGDCLESLAAMPERSAHVCVTSPPYFGLRDYGTGRWTGGDSKCNHRAPPCGGRKGALLKGPSNREGYGADGQYRDVCKKCGARREDKQVGAEPLPDCLAWARKEEPCDRCFVCAMVRVFRAVRRVLRDDGTLWLNLGDSFSGGGQGGGGKERSSLKGSGNRERQGGQRRPLPSGGIAPKNLLGIPWRVALALQADGWVLRSDVPWVKRGAMPESVHDRPAKALEYFFLFAKGPRYYFDMGAVRPRSQNGESLTGRRKRNPDKFVKHDTGGKAATRRGFANIPEGKIYPTRNFRNADLWFQSVAPPHGLVGAGDELVGLDVTSEGFPGAHFATFSPKLIRPLILASTSQAGCCSKCGAPHRRILRKTRRPTRPGKATKVRKDRDGGTAGLSGEHSPDGRAQFRDGKEVGNRDPQRHCTETRTVGWEPSCECFGRFEERTEEVTRGGKKTIRRYRVYVPEGKQPRPAPCVVLDPFAGSCTTGVVALRHGRKFVGCELSEEYLAMGRRRLKNRGRVGRPQPDRPKIKGLGIFGQGG